MNMPRASTATYFYQECPTCGRALRVRVSYLGKKMICEHCQGAFIASDPDNPHTTPQCAAPTMLERASLLLDSLEKSRALVG
ncbi:MAG: hypothetical protein SFX18_06630 [Pirellulales bacterium]|nr:hypothetical protein [Pirellulales bacterium]